VAEQSAFIAGFVADASHYSRSLYLIGSIRNCALSPPKVRWPSRSKKICPPVANSGATAGIPIRKPKFRHVSRYRNEWSFPVFVPN
jgi:hypothetical protein